jgi:hypothetical protein
MAKLIDLIEYYGLRSAPAPGLKSAACARP